MFTARHLDVESISLFWGNLKQHGAGPTALIVSHDYRVVAQADQVYGLEGGRLYRLRDEELAHRGARAQSRNKTCLMSAESRRITVEDSAMSVFADPAQKLPLKAALGDGEEAITAWRSWQSSGNLDRMDGGSFRLLPLLHRNPQPIARYAALAASSNIY